MGETDREFRALMEKVLGHSDAASKELLDRYQSTLLRAIRRRLNRKIRSKFDSLDFAQDVWASFFADLPQEKSFARPEDLVAYLSALAENKVIEAVRQRLLLQKYNVTRERSLDDSREVDKEQLIGPQRSPQDAVAGDEEWQEFLRKQPLVYRRIYSLLRDGTETKKIANELAISERTVLRVVNRLSSRSMP
ncbi:MAG: hypothetical protein FJ271_13550 [Planctomycetes bacterium]|nr:hypothetical protein [Planctomycetota bacterium]